MDEVEVYEGDQGRLSAVVQGKITGGGRDSWFMTADILSTHLLYKNLYATALHATSYFTTVQILYDYLCKVRPVTFMNNIATFCHRSSRDHSVRRTDKANSVDKANAADRIDGAYRFLQTKG